MDLKYIVIILSTILLIYIIYKEIKKENRDRLIWRLLASVVAIVALALMAIPLNIKSKINGNASEINIITTGVSKDSVKNLKNIFKINDGENSLSDIKGENIADLNYFLASKPNINKINIYGNGLTNSDLKNIKEQEISFHPSLVGTGVIAIQWPQKIQETNNLKIQGTFKNTENKSIKLLLKGYGKTLDSTLIKQNQTEKFAFNAQPKSLGKSTYQIVAVLNKDTLTNEIIPFEVLPKKQLKILLLTSFPDFDYKFLKNWLYENKYPVAVRSQISKDKYSTDFLNLEVINLFNISSSLLKNFDNVIVDETELASWNATQQNILQQAVEDGLGLIITLSEAKAKTNLSNRIGRFELNETSLNELKLKSEIEPYAFSNLNIEQKLFLQPKIDDDILVQDASGRPIAASRMLGFGKIANTSLTSSFNWSLAGETKSYSKFWSLLLNNTARKNTPEFKSHILPQFPTIFEKTIIRIDQNSELEKPEIKLNNFKLSMRQNVELPFQWDTFTWPEKAGWNDLEINSQLEGLFIYSEDQWKVLRANQQIEENTQFVTNRSFKKKSILDPSQTTTNNLSLWWMVIPFIISVAYIWYEDKFLNIK